MNPTPTIYSACPFLSHANDGEVDATRRNKFSFHEHRLAKMLCSLPPHWQSRAMKHFAWSIFASLLVVILLQSEMRGRMLGISATR